MAANPLNYRSPDTLQDLCFFFCANNVEYLSSSLLNSRDPDDDSLSVFSVVLGNKLLDHYLSKYIPNKESKTFIDMLLINKHVCNSLKINRKGMLSRENIHQLACNTLRHLDLTLFYEFGTMHLEEGFAELIKKNRSSLVSLKIKDNVGAVNCTSLVQSMCHQRCDLDADCLSLDEQDVNACGDGNSSSDVKRLKHLSYTNNLRTQEDTLEPQLVQVLKENPGLQSFSFVSAGSFPCVDFLTKKVLSDMHNLTSLILSSDAAKPDKLLGEDNQIFLNLPKLQQLKHLDLSYGIPITSTSPLQGLLKFTDATVTSFKEAVLQMPRLKSLDISGTNLTSIVHHPDGLIGCYHFNTCMPGFENRHFDYLGLYFSDACQHQNIPADKVSGTDSEAQLTVGLWAHQHNQTIMYFLLKELDVHMKAMTHSLEKPMAIFEGLVACLEQTGDWSLLCQIELNSFSTELKNVENLYTCLYYLFYFRALKMDIAMQWKRRVLDCVIVTCCNCVRDIPVTTGVTKNCLMQIARLSLLVVMILRLHKTVVNEVPINCELFVSLRGCDKVLRTCEKRADKHEVVYSTTGALVNLSDDLKRKVSGAMCNVSEVSCLRPLLMTEPLVKLFRQWLEVFDQSHYDVTSHAAAFLVLLAADGPEAWTVASPSRDEVVADVDRVIKEHWDIMKSKGVRFRSLKPMAEQLDNFGTPAAQHWGAWMILNLVTVQPNRYCPMVVKENVTEILLRTLENEELRPDIQELMSQICTKTMAYMTQAGMNAPIAD